MMTEALQIRRAEAADAPACAAIIGAWIESTPWMPEGPSREKLSELIEAAMPKRELWVIGAPVEGYLSLDPEKLHIGGFYCARRGVGLGKALIEHIKQGRDFLSLNTHQPNERAQKFYEREGFEKTVLQEDETADGIPEWRMEWRR